MRGFRLDRTPDHEEQLRGGLVFKARRLFVSLNSRLSVIKRKKKVGFDLEEGVDVRGFRLDRAPDGIALCLD